MKLVEAAKRSGEWDRPIDVRTAEVPEELAAAARPRRRRPLPQGHHAGDRSVNPPNDKTVTFSNVYDDQRRAEAYAKLEYPGTYYLAFRVLPAIIAEHVKGRTALDFGCGAGRS